MYAGVVNELYYAKDNVPVFHQFKNTYQFYDDAGRFYLIAVKNRQIFANTRFKNTRRGSEPREPDVNNYDFAKLYVKLSEPTVKWFTHNDVGKQLILYERVSGRSFVVTLKMQEKNGAKRRTGSVWVKGLDRLTLVALLNQ